ncbi:hypothetical protein SJAG_16454 [Schizosaccharomyces japonicus yFS275]|uniref:Ubiquitin-like protease family profile domain-containing protein n=1 Tax=Schizosaccharomyces japonicus (strain yFS275 / FY16936) TaxID=402676 RepID=T0S115_SCHJY|nr:hypothetical protein SJAG_16454 [Schizosaccharomyces japonicus yFS275]EQC53007.1 hypothetical protein SJAG_16454 [Schizosaccharomyces japonicus yFS275]
MTSIQVIDYNNYHVLFFTPTKCPLIPHCDYPTLLVLTFFFKACRLLGTMDESKTKSSKRRLSISETAGGAGQGNEDGREAKRVSAQSGPAARRPPNPLDAKSNAAALQKTPTASSSVDKGLVLPFTVGGYGGFYDKRGGCLLFTKQMVTVRYRDCQTEITIPVNLLKHCYWIQGWEETGFCSRVHALQLTLKTRDMTRVSRGDSSTLLFLYEPKDFPIAQSAVNLLGDTPIKAPGSLEEFRRLLVLKCPDKPRTSDAANNDQTINRQQALKSTLSAQLNTPERQHPFSQQQKPKETLPESAPVRILPPSLRQETKPIDTPPLHTPSSNKTSSLLPSSSTTTSSSSSSMPSSTHTAKSTFSSSDVSYPSPFPVFTPTSDSLAHITLSPTKQAPVTTNADSRLESQTLLVFPPHGPNAVSITPSDVLRLKDGEFLNDTIVDFYLRYLYSQLEIEHPELAQATHIFNTYFFNRLVSKDKHGKQLGHSGVRKWTAKIDLFTKKYIVVPVNEDFHWYLAIICNVDKLIGSNSTATEPSETRVRSSNRSPLSSTSPVILLFDSLSNMHKSTLRYLREYIIDEARERKHVELSPYSLRGFHAKVPQQSNFSDCGVYTLHYVELFLSSPSQILSDILDRPTLASNRRHQKSFNDFWNVKRISSRRDEMKNLIKTLSKEWLASKEQTRRTSTGDEPPSATNGNSSSRSSEPTSNDHDTSKEDDDDDDLTVL